MGKMLVAQVYLFLLTLTLAGSANNNREDFVDESITFLDNFVHKLEFDDVELSFIQLRKLEKLEISLRDTIKKRLYRPRQLAISFSTSVKEKIFDKMRSITMFLFDNALGLILFFKIHMMLTGIYNAVRTIFMMLGCGPLMMTVAILNKMMFDMTFSIPKAVNNWIKTKILDNVFAGIRVLLKLPKTDSKETRNLDYSDIINKVFSMDTLYNITGAIMSAITGQITSAKNQAGALVKWLDEMQKLAKIMIKEVLIGYVVAPMNGFIHQAMDFIKQLAQAGVALIPGGAQAIEFAFKVTADLKNAIAFKITGKIMKVLTKVLQKVFIGIIDGVKDKIMEFAGIPPEAVDFTSNLTKIQPPNATNPQEELDKKLENENREAIQEMKEWAQEEFAEEHLHMIQQQEGSIDEKESSMNERDASFSV